VHSAGRLATTETAAVLASWVALAVTKVGANGDDVLRGTARPISFWGLAYNSQRTFQNCWTPRGARAGG
jgi:hypothetical protein